MDTGGLQLYTSDLLLSYVYQSSTRIDVQVCAQTDSFAFLKQCRHTFPNFCKCRESPEFFRWQYLTYYLMVLG
jgi:hypothetical protein